MRRRCGTAPLGLRNPTARDDRSTLRFSGRECQPCGFQHRGGGPHDCPAVRKPLTRNIRNKLTRGGPARWRAMGNAALRTTHSGRLRISTTERSVVRSPHALVAPQSAEVERDFPRTQRVIDYTGPPADRNREGLRLAPDDVGVDRHLFAISFRWIAWWRRTIPWRRS